MKINRSAVKLIVPLLFAVACAKGYAEDPNASNILLDEAHNNVHTSEGSYKTFVELLSEKGHQITANTNAFEDNVLKGYDILVISIARSEAGRSENPAFTDAECDVVHNWVEGGGALLLVTDHYPTGYGAENLGNRFGVDMSKGTTSDTERSPDGRAGGVLVFSRERGAIGDHPITRNISQIATFTGQSLKGPEGSTALLKFSDSAVDLMLRDAAEDTGIAESQSRSEARENAPTVSAAGRSQAVAFPYGNGRVVVLGEASHITAQRPGRGMEYPDTDNRQWVINIIDWLSGQPEAQDE